MFLIILLNVFSKRCFDKAAPTHCIMIPLWLVIFLFANGAKFVALVFHEIAFSTEYATTF